MTAVRGWRELKMDADTATHEGYYPTTIWSEVDRTRSCDSQVAMAALGALLEKYSRPLIVQLGFKFHVDEERAADWLHEFIARKVLLGELLSKASRGRGRFRTFLLNAIDNFVVSELRKEQAKKRQPQNGTVSLDDLSPGEEPGLAAQSADGFTLEWDHLVRRQTTVCTYARCRCFRSLTNGAKVFLQYQPLKGWLKPWKVTLVSDDASGLSRDEIKRVLKYCKSYRLLLVEVAIDFSSSMGINKKFIRSHAVFGKSRRRAYTKENDLYYGGRKADKLIRCYEKPKVGAYRVELELHSGLLRRHSISALDDLVRLPALVCPKHLQLVDLDWSRLRRHLANKIGSSSDGVIAAARRRRTSLSRLRQYLRRKGVANTHRFLVPRTMNKDVSRALKEWVRGFDGEQI